MRMLRLPLSVALGLLLGSSAPASAQEPLAGLIARVIQSSTINRTSPTGQPGGTHEPHFLVGESLQRTARQMNVVLGAQVLSLPLASSSGGFSFATDPATGEVKPTSQTFGPTFAERAVTIGRGKVNVGFSFQNTTYDAFEGVALDSGGLSFIREHNDCCVGAAGNPLSSTNFDPAFERDLLRTDLSLEIESRASAIFANFGITDRFDVGLAVPFVNVDISARVDGQILRTASNTNPLIHSFDGAGAATASFVETGSASGLGDVLLRAKYNVFRSDTSAFAGALDLRLPTGDKDELLGTGATQATFFAIYSGDYGRVSPHVNFGFTLSTGEASDAAAAIDVDTNVHRLDTIPGGAAALPVAPVDLSVPDEVNFAAGVSVAAAPRVTIGFDLRGRRLLDVPRFELRDNVYPNRAAGTLPTAPFTAQQEFSLRDDANGMTLLLGIVGAKINIARTLLLNASVLFPMNDAGLKPKPTLAIGLDYVF